MINCILKQLRRWLEIAISAHYFSKVYISHYANEDIYANIQVRQKFCFDI